LPSSFASARIATKRVTKIDARLRRDAGTPSR
jgi:hypothetical protein